MKEIIFMIRLVFFSFLIFYTVSLYSQPNEQRREVGSFTSIDIKGSIDIVIVPSDNYKVIIHSSSPDDIVTEIKENKLYVYTKKGKSLAWNEMRSIGKKYAAYIYAPSLAGIEASGSGNLSIEGVLKADNLSFSIAGSGNVAGQLNVETLKLKSAGSGNFRLKGNIVNADISSSGSGNIQAFDLFVDNCTISKSGSGNTQITAVKSLNASISGSGNLNYKGSPINVSSSSSGTGKIKKV